MMTTKEHSHAFAVVRSAGVNACLVKPFMPAALRKTLEEVWPAGDGGFGGGTEGTATLL